MGNSPEIGEFPAQMASNAENVPFDDAIMQHKKGQPKMPYMNRIVWEVIYNKLYGVYWENTSLKTTQPNDIFWYPFTHSSQQCRRVVIGINAIT